MRRIIEALFFLSLIFLTSLTWVLYHWPYAPDEAIADVGKLGVIGFIFDIAFVGLMFRWFRPRKDID